MLVLSLLTLFTTLYYPERQRRAALQEMETRTRLLAEMVSMGVGIGLELNQLSAVQAAVNWAKDDPSLVYVEVADLGEQVFASFNPSQHPVDSSVRPTPEGLVRERDGLLHIAVPIVYQERDLGVLRLGTTLALTQREIARFRTTALLVSVLALVLGSALALFLARRITEPLRRLRDAADEVSSGNLNVDIDRSGGDEVGRMAEAFGLMVDRLSEMLAKLEANSQSLRVARDDALAAARAKAEFLAAMSHEIRTPMNGVIGMLALLDETTLSPKQREYVSTATGSAQSLITVINDILDFSKLEAGKLDVERIPVDVRTIAEDVAQLLTDRVQRKGLALRSRIDNQLPDLVLGDPVRLRQVLVNLGDNAVKFTDAGWVELTVDYAPGPGSTGSVVIDVRDSGIGMSSEVQARLFQPFSQADSSTTRRFGGTGLGLSIVRRLVERMGGTIELDSAAGRGSRFRVLLPTEPAGEIAPSDHSLHGCSVVVVHGNPRDGEVLTHYLSSAGATSAIVPTLAGVVGEAGAAVAVPDALVVEANQITAHSLGALRSQECFEAVPMVVVAPARAEIHEQGVAERLVVIETPVRRARLLETVAAAWAGDIAVDASVPPTAAVEPSLRGSRARVLLAEDHETNRMLAVEVLEMAGFVVDVVEDGEQAVAARFQADYDVVLMDCQMPTMDGLEATRLIRRREHGAGSTHVPIVALTANAIQGDRELCLDAGMDDYLSKPFTPRELLATLEKWLPNTGSSVGANAADSPFDLTRLADMLSGNEDKMRRHLRAFVDVTGGMLAELHQAIHAGDAAEVRRLAHKAKGASGMVGAPALTEVAAGMERSAAEGDLGDAEQAYERLDEAYEAARDFALSY